MFNASLIHQQFNIKWRDNTDKLKKPTFGFYKRLTRNYQVNMNENELTDHFNAMYHGSFRKQLIKCNVNDLRNMGRKYIFDGLQYMIKNRKLQINELLDPNYVYADIIDYGESADVYYILGQVRCLIDKEYDAAKIYYTIALCVENHLYRPRLI